MKVTTEEVGKNKVEITIEVPEQKFEESLERAYRIVVKKINVPGFRKGKAPRFLVENMYGREIFMEEALQDAVPQAYEAALKEIADTVVSEPEFEMVQSDKGEPLVFKATVVVQPEVELGQYKGLSLEKTVVEVKEEEIDQEIEKMRQSYAQLIVLEEAAAQGDFLTIDFVGKIDGVAFPGGSGENHSLELGSGTFIPGFEEQLIGVKAGETKEVELTFPEEYHASDLAGKAAVFTVVVQEVKRQVLAPLDDEFAKDVSEFDTLQELREDVTNKLKKVAENKAEFALRKAATQKVADNVVLEIPEVMVENRVNEMLNDLHFRLAQQGISFKKYLEITQKSVEDLAEMYRPDAEASVKTDLVLEKIAEVENIVVAEEEVTNELEKIARQHKQEVEQVRDFLKMQGQLSKFELGLKLDKAVDFIIEQADLI